MSQVFRNERLQRDVRGAGSVLLQRNHRHSCPELADGARHGRAAVGREDAIEDAPEAHAAAAPVRKNRRAAVRGECVRLRGAERVADYGPGRVDRVQRGPLAAGHSGRVGRHVQLPGAEDLLAVVLGAPAAKVSERQQRRADRQTRQRHQRHDVLAKPHLGPHPVNRLKMHFAFHTHTHTYSHTLTHIHDPFRSGWIHRGPRGPASHPQTYFSRCFYPSDDTS